MGPRHPRAGKPGSGPLGHPLHTEPLNPKFYWDSQDFNHTARNAVVPLEIVTFFWD